MAGFETERIDPSHRLFLECVWEAIEAAAIVLGRSGSVTGVFGGGEGGYERENLDHLEDHSTTDRVWMRDMGFGLQVRLGNALDFFTTRVSHKLDLTGPSVAVRAACATSLWPLTLRSGRCGAGNATWPSWAARRCYSPRSLATCRTSTACFPLRDASNPSMPAPMERFSAMEWV